MIKAHSMSLIHCMMLNEYMAHTFMTSNILNFEGILGIEFCDEITADDGFQLIENANFFNKSNSYSD